MVDESDIVVEIHVPLTRPTSLEDDTDPYPWIDDVMNYLDDVESRGDVSVIDDGDEFEGAYVFSVADAPEQTLLAVATGIANLPGLPTGIFAVVTDDLAEEFGVGRRVELA